MRSNSIDPFAALPRARYLHATRPAACLLVLLAASFIPGAATAHGVANADQGFIESNVGLALVPYLYLGAKHMVTGYDHLLFLAGVIFFLYRLRDVALYVTLFALGHSVTLLVGVLGGIHADPFLIDALIGLSVAYKGFENLGGFKTLGWVPDTRLAVLVFGLAHGFGLATKLQDVAIAPEGLVGNMLAFNAGVEMGQFTALALILITFNLWRATGRFLQHAAVANWMLMLSGFTLIGYQMSGYWLG
ncbi:MAG: HupE/UreJ family protein [Pseudomonadales bacterium]|nr:HupE/UreJ family protein [Pseudomonadales bacterium]MDP6472854.1 HupE/UreJ family protein [Pseudomonadales bacterium]MDP6826390.1 HupE/UreJ family protein [Pseudomonadales bacterium]MDP6972526.1 HupE/UreJ family protein [Pseudomonadales bacterium]